MNQNVVVIRQSTAPTTSLPELPAEVVLMIVKEEADFRPLAISRQIHNQLMQWRLQGFFLNLDKPLVDAYLKEYYRKNMFQLKAPDRFELLTGRARFPLPPYADRIRNLEIVLPINGTHDLMADPWRFTLDSYTLLTFVMRLPLPMRELTARIAQSFRSMAPLSRPGAVNSDWQNHFPELDKLRIVIWFKIKPSEHQCLSQIVDKLRMADDRMLVLIRPKVLEVDFRDWVPEENCSCRENFAEFIESLVELRHSMNRSFTEYQGCSL
ncbi:hypothetical protein DM02DRAFT_627777 [Periconia macrospinosa]|uniref:Uncharacterized protein n=1 Tax=Periconia macrospinosa TaxID=97972 RepID=A0A2V1DTB2_9PLEO|nr:hypothetical protein DM02DRAFT_627777 [Periconia macrospinosa]